MSMEDDGEDKDDAKRRTRNLSEKKRRDQFNMLINELNSMVTINNRKMDKSSVLKSTISFLRNHKEVTVRSQAHDVQEDWKPSFLSNEEFTYLVLEALEGFVMVMSASGQIYYVSESITTLLGHNPANVLNKNIFDIIYKEDHQNLYNILQSGAALDPMQVGNKENEIRFQCHLRRACGLIDFNADVTYELLQFNGHFRPSMEERDSEDLLPCQQDNDSRMLFVCTGRLYTPQFIKDVSLVDTSRNEFTSRHSLEWKYLFLDHRASPIIGYLPFEVLGTSGYDYYHFDDLEKVVNCHEALMQKGELTSCYYRFLTKGQQWIWLQTRFYISYHQWNSKPEFVVCTHRVVSYADIAKSMKQESAEVETVSELESNQAMKEDPPEEAITASTHYIPDRTSVNAYQNLSQSQPRVVELPSATSSTVGTVDTAGSTATARSWPRSQPRYATGSDSALQSGDSRSSQRNSSRDDAMSSQTRKDSQLGVLHTIGAQYVEPAPYVSVPVTTVLPLPMHPLPVLVASDHTQLQLPRQQQLQRKHEELQQMIVQQQEELRQVKEQLLLARLGILQPFINVQNLYVSQEEVQQGQRIQPQSIVYEGTTPRPAVQYLPHPPSEHNPRNNMAE